jgi:putative copper resistance protein D
VDAPSLGEVLGKWSFDVPWIAAAAMAIAWYARAFLQARRLGSRHSSARLALFCSGVVLALVAVVSPLEHYGNQLLWVNFTGFLFLTMIAPALILLGAPLTLAFRVASPPGRKNLRGLYRHRVVAMFTFPVFTWLLFAVVTYLWQFTGLADQAAEHVFVRDLQQLTSFAVGLLFWLPAIASDPLRWRLAYPLRALYVFVEMTHKGLFGGMFLSMNTAMHAGFAANIPAWGPDAMTDQRIAILILWIGGNLVFIVGLVAIILGWMRYEQRNQRRVDWRLRLQREASERKRRALDQVFTKGV